MTGHRKLLQFLRNKLVYSAHWANEKLLKTTRKIEIKIS